MGERYQSWVHFGSSLVSNHLTSPTCHCGSGRRHMDLVVHSGADFEASDTYFLEVILALVVLAVTLVFRRSCLADHTSGIDQIVLPSGAVISISHGSY